MPSGRTPPTPQDPREASSGKLDVELRRGVLVLAVLSQLRAPQYGYSLRQALEAEGMSIEEGTLYPLLRRLESQGLLASEWRIEDGPPRRYYTLNADGLRHLEGLAATWAELVATVDRLLSPGSPPRRQPQAGTAQDAAPERRGGVPRPSPAHPASGDGTARSTKGKSPEGVR